MQITKPAFVEDANEILEDLVVLRRDLHRYPELGLHLPRTQARVLEAISDLGLEITTGEELSSVVAVLQGGRPGDTVLLRGDMDGLPMQEEVDLEYASINGNMHACGHDLHTAGLVGAARLLAQHRDELPGNVIFMFQPGEESPGGAEPMIAEGLLEVAGEKPIAAYALHVVAARRGVFISKAGSIMASRSELSIRVRGAGAHASRPHSGIDPVAPLAEIVSALNTMVTKAYDVLDPVVLTVTQLEASEAVNVVPDSARLGASIRTLSDKSLKQIQRDVERVGHGIAAAHGCTAEIDFTVDYPVTNNNPIETARALEALAEQFGPERIQELPAPRMGSEDFSFILNEVPGAFIFLGATPDGVNPQAASNHSPRVQFDDSVLGDQAAALASLAWQRLHRARIEANDA
jgi:hippurate hydrolase